MHNLQPIELTSSTPTWYAKNGLFAFIEAVGFTDLTFAPVGFPVVASLEYQQSTAGNQGLKINGYTVPVNPAPESITYVALVWKTWGEENLKILVDSQSEQPAVLINKVPVEVAYDLALAVTHNPNRPNIHVTNVSGPLDFTLNGTVVGNSGLLTMQLTNNLFAINFVNGKAEGAHNYIVGAGEEVALCYVHNVSGLKYYLANPA